VRISAASVRGRVIVVGRGGRLLVDSAGTPAGRSYADRPELRAALRGHATQLSRNSATLGTEILATAVPVVEFGKTVGAVRVTQSITAVNHAVRSSIVDLGILAGVVLLLGLAVGSLIARQIVQPIRRLDAAARDVAAGRLDTAVALEGSAEQRSLGGAFNEMTQRVKRLLRSHQDFVADASHQLRTPLTGLRLRLENLEERLGANRSAKADVDASLGEIDRLSLIVDELLVLRRAGEHELPGESVDLGRAARRAAERWRHGAEERGLTLETRAENAGTTWCAPADLDRSLDALLENAIRYSPAGATVTVAAAPGRIEICDEGPGLEQGEEEAVFERFRRGSAGRRGPGGTGLGLPIARELTRQWGGEVSIANRDGGGLRAVIEVPQ
jgi:signal transduction histidine kinase